MTWLRTRFRRGVALIVAVAVAAMLGGFLFAWSGVYNVAASRAHSGPVEWLLAFVMRNSVRTQSAGIEPSADLASADRIVLGAAHFQDGCAFCHGAPGVRRSVVTASTLPSAPDLRPIVPLWEDRDLFWVVKHGIKYTGMPAWVSQERDDEVWSVVAFLRQLPTLSEEEYRTLAAVAVDPDLPGAAVSDLGTVVSCVRCHGDIERRPGSGLVPALHGQSFAYMATALREYSAGSRASGIMQPLAAALREEDIVALAQYYADLPVLPVRFDVSQPEALAVLGETIARAGIAADDVPACVTCHGADRLPAYPGLAGQHAPYLTAKLRLWKQGFAGGTEGAAIMAPIAARLSDDNIAAVSAYYATLPPDAAP